VKGAPVLAHLHAATIRVQVPVVLVAIPAVAALYGLVLIHGATVLAGDDAQPETVDAIAHALRVAVWSLVACVAAATGAAALLLRGSLRATVERIESATLAIADGTFSHRIRSGRQDELGRLAATIDTMAERLERLEQSRRRLLACVSHELRTPLTIIQGTAFTLARNEPDPDRRARLALVQDESAHLAALIEDLMDASCLHAGGVRLDVEPCDLGALVDATCARFEELARARGLAVVVSGAERRVLLDVDPIRFDQVLGNLLANAIRHAIPCSTIDVRVEASAARHGSHEVVVANRGAAIAAGLRARLFEPFEQGEGGGRLGLGLTIAHGLVASHGGELVLASDGTGDDGVVAFRVMLPVQRPRPDRAEVEEPALTLTPRRRHATLRAVET
jgi:signal transduction histidine kinase